MSKKDNKNIPIDKKSEECLEKLIYEINEKMESMEGLYDRVLLTVQFLEDIIDKEIEELERMKKCLRLSVDCANTLVKKEENQCITYKNYTY